MPDDAARWMAAGRPCAECGEELVRAVFAREHRPEDRRSDRWWMVEIVVHPTPELAAVLRERGVLDA